MCIGNSEKMALLKTHCSRNVFKIIIRCQEMQDFKLFTPDPPCIVRYPELLLGSIHFSIFLQLFFLILQNHHCSWKEGPSIFCRQMQYYSCMSSVNSRYIGIIIYLLSMSCDLSIWRVYQITFCQT